MSVIGVIDIGTNTILCLKAGASPKGFAMLYDGRFHYRAGRRLDEQGNISPDYKAGMRQALKSAMANLTDCVQVKIVATEVLRRPRDGSQFAEELSREIGLPIEIIDPVREAQLSFAGATQGFGTGDDEIAVVDIGGGSTELAIGSSGKLNEFAGAKIGAVALAEHAGYEQPAAVYIDYAKRILNDSGLAGLAAKIPEKVIVVGGSAVAIAGILIGLRDFEPDKIQGFIVEETALGRLVTRLAKMNLQRRQEVMPFDPQRADIIVPGGAIILAFMMISGGRSLTVSARGLRYGLIYELAAEINA